MIFLGLIFIGIVLYMIASNQEESNVIARQAVSVEPTEDPRMGLFLKAQEDIREQYLEIKPDFVKNDTEFKFSEADQSLHKELGIIVAFASVCINQSDILGILVKSFNDKTNVLLDIVNGAIETENKDATKTSLIEARELLINRRLLLDQKVLAASATEILSNWHQDEIQQLVQYSFEQNTAKILDLLDAKIEQCTNV